MFDNNKKDKGTGTLIGNTIFYSDGTSSTIIGNTIYNSDGTSSTKVGNTWMNSDGTSSTKIGNTYMHSNGTSSTNIGSTWMNSSNGSSTIVGNTIFNSGSGNLSSYAMFENNQSGVKSYTIPNNNNNNYTHTSYTVARTPTSNPVSFANPNYKSISTTSYNYWNNIKKDQEKNKNISSLNKKKWI